MTQRLWRYDLRQKRTIAVCLTWLAAFSLSGCLIDSEVPDTDSSPVRLTFLHTSDIHSRLIPYEFQPNATDQNLGLLPENAPFGGAARMAYLLKRERERSQRVLHLDSGDCFQGAPIYNFAQGEAELRFMSLVRPDAVVIGNHEFDSGVRNYVEQLRRWKNFANLAANYVFPDPKDPNNHQLGNFSEAYSIHNLDGIRVGVIGMANLSSLNSIGEGGNSLQLLPLEQNTVLQHYVTFLRPHVDILTIVSHLGLEEDRDLITGYEHTVRRDRLEPDWEIVEDFGNGNVRVFIPGVSGVDIIFGGHLHTVLNPPQVVEAPDGRETIMVHSGAFAKFVGRFDAVIDNDPDNKEPYRRKKVLSHKFQIFPVDNRLKYLEDPAVVRVMQPYEMRLNQRFDLTRVVGYAPKLIPRRGSSDSADSPLGNLVAEAMRVRRRVEAEFALTNTLGIRDNLFPGPITLESMFNVFPFENSVSVIYMSGYDVQDLFDFITMRGASRGCQAQAQIAGARFVQNCAQVIANDRFPENYKRPGENVLINGVPVELNGSYKVAANDYIAAGGSGFQVLRRNTQKFNTGVSLRDALVDYMQTFPTCAEYAEKSGVCGLGDPESVRLCAELTAYANAPCVTAEQDGRIGTKLVLGEDQGAVDDDDDKINDDQGGGGTR